MCYPLWQVTLFRPLKQKNTIQALYPDSGTVSMCQTTEIRCPCIRLQKCIEVCFNYRNIYIYIFINNCMSFWFLIDPTPHNCQCRRHCWKNVEHFIPCSAKLYWLCFCKWQIAHSQVRVKYLNSSHDFLQCSGIVWSESRWQLAIWWSLAKALCCYVNIYYCSCDTFIAGSSKSTEFVSDDLWIGFVSGIFT